ncbi:MAG TPA: SRPBCC family protein [Roseiflexaceae bacterium]|nr:SRPBCC family protein [Roseiflexaceae bacterium]
MHTPEHQRSVVHSTFSVERTYPASPARVFAAFSNQATKRRWFAEGEGWEVDEFTMDFRVGGRETSRFRFKGGPPMGNDTVYLDIVADQRIVLAYTMTAGDTRISASLATVEIAPAGDGARLLFTEQGAFFDGADKPGLREAGTRELLDKLGEELRAH